MLHRTILLISIIAALTGCAAQGPATPATAPATIQFRAAIPNMIVRDLSAAATFYITKLGFTRTGSGPRFIVLRRDHVTLSLIQQSAHKLAGNSWCYLTVADPAAIFHEYQEQQVKILAPLKDWGGGHIEFTIADPDGNILDIGN
jgi:catechol 2,3-dioxygenase-like lactoylglutathione lyase family enzyme